jgi:hypothetical protein
MDMAVAVARHLVKVDPGNGVPLSLEPKRTLCSLAVPNGSKAPGFTSGRSSPFQNRIGKRRSGERVGEDSLLERVTAAGAATDPTAITLGGRRRPRPRKPCQQKGRGSHETATRSRSNCGFSCRRIANNDSYSMIFSAC